MAKSTQETWATGRRKEAAASVRMKAGSGKVMVNDRAFDNYFPNDTLRGYIVQPLTITGAVAAFDVAATIKGGGSVG